MTDKDKKFLNKLNDKLEIEECANTFNFANTPYWWKVFFYQITKLIVDSFTKAINNIDSKTEDKK